MTSEARPNHPKCTCRPRCNTTQGRHSSESERRGGFRASSEQPQSPCRSPNKLRVKKFTHALRVSSLFQDRHFFAIFASSRLKIRLPICVNLRRGQNPRPPLLSLVKPSLKCIDFHLRESSLAVRNPVPVLYCEL